MAALTLLLVSIYHSGLVKMSMQGSSTNGANNILIVYGNIYSVTIRRLRPVPPKHPHRCFIRLSRVRRTFSCALK
jgi:hypothetical protein